MAESASLVTGLASALAGDEHEHAAESWTAELTGFVDRARAAYPELDAPTVEQLATCLRAVGCAAPSALASLDAAELWLAAACGDADAAAVAIFDRHYVARLQPALRSMDLSPSEVEEIQQRVRQRLLTAEPAQPLLLYQYAGQGRLFGLVKVIAIRMALDDIRRRQRAPDRGSADAYTVARLMDGELGPELMVVEAQHREAVKGAFAQAVEALPDQQRTILRMHLLDGASIDEIAALHDVHRATAARWVIRIREQLATGTHEALRTRLALDDAHLQSLLRAVDSRLDLSLSRVLAPTSDSEGEPSEER